MGGVVVLSSDKGFLWGVFENKHEPISQTIDDSNFTGIHQRSYHVETEPDSIKKVEEVGGWLLHLGKSWKLLSQ